MNPWINTKGIHGWGVRGTVKTSITLYILNVYETTQVCGHLKVRYSHNRQADWALTEGPVSGFKDMQVL
jgi:hypothetical protein